jgi:predicted nucleotidyltransferase
VTVDELIGRARVVMARWGDLRFAVLFGSAIARGPDGARDIDVAASFARPLPWLELAARALELEDALGGSRSVDLVDLADASTLLRWEVLQTGRLILAGDADAWRSFQTAVPLEWDDLRPYFDREREGLSRVLLGAGWSGSTS